jgi:hypothetical protein
MILKMTLRWEQQLGRIAIKYGYPSGVKAKVKAAVQEWSAI